MPIYEYYCRENHTIYQFYAKTLAQGRTVPPCPDNSKYPMRKLVSSFAVTKGGKSEDAPAAPAPSCALSFPADALAWQIPAEPPAPGGKPPVRTGLPCREIVASRHPDAGWQPGRWLADGPFADRGRRQAGSW